MPTNPDAGFPLASLIFPLNFTSLAGVTLGAVWAQIVATSSKKVNSKLTRPLMVFPSLKNECPETPGGPEEQTRVLSIDERTEGRRADAMSAGSCKNLPRFADKSQRRKTVISVIGQAIQR
jgi:hypothetical protein